MASMKRWPQEASHVAGNLRFAVRDLASGRGRIIERWRHAHASHLFMIFDADLPDALVSDWQDIHARLTEAGPILGEGDKVIRGSVDHTLDGMSEEDAADLAERLVVLTRKYEDAIRKKD